MRSLSTSALGQPSETNETRGAEAFWSCIRLDCHGEGRMAIALFPAMVSMTLSPLSLNPFHGGCHFRRVHSDAPAAAGFASELTNIAALRLALVIKEAPH